ncbi:unnamed protein product [Protopolystoma xenopodis]|uniref:Uncharacterized protein n=1 Tax=Protopolystoma xenopodis TaxID=117903 RepID=A0A3S5FHC4_9PLAT|nr:unnamed protein product [Protopolystoma xenopodis]
MLPTARGTADCLPAGLSAPVSLFGPAGVEHLRRYAPISTTGCLSDLSSPSQADIIRRGHRSVGCLYDLTPIIRLSTSQLEAEIDAVRLSTLSNPMESGDIYSDIHSEDRKTSMNVQSHILVPIQPSSIALNSALPLLTNLGHYRGPQPKRTKQSTSGYGTRKGKQNNDENHDQENPNGLMNNFTIDSKVEKDCMNESEAAIRLVDSHSCLELVARFPFPVWLSQLQLTTSEDAPFALAGPSAISLQFYRDLPNPFSCSTDSMLCPDITEVCSWRSRAVLTGIFGIDGFCGTSQIHAQPANGGFLPRPYSFQPRMDTAFSSRTSALKGNKSRLELKPTRNYATRTSNLGNSKVSLSARHAKLTFPACLVTHVLVRLYAESEDEQNLTYTLNTHISELPQTDRRQIRLAEITFFGRLTGTASSVSKLPKTDLNLSIPISRNFEQPDLTISDHNFLLESVPSNS